MLFGEVKPDSNETVNDPTRAAYHISLAAAATETVHTVLGFDCGLFGCDLYTN